MGLLPQGLPFCLDIFSLSLSVPLNPPALSAFAVKVLVEVSPDPLLSSSINCGVCQFLGEKVNSCFAISRPAWFLMPT